MNEMMMEVVRKAIFGLRKLFIEVFTSVTAKPKAGPAVLKYSRVAVPVDGGGEVQLSGILGKIAMVPGTMTFFRVPEDILENAAGGPKKEVVCQELLKTWLEDQAKRGWNIVPMDEFGVKHPSGRGYVMPFLKGMRFSEAFFLAFGLEAPMENVYKAGGYMRQPVNYDKTIKRMALVVNAKIWRNLCDGFSYTREAFGFCKGNLVKFVGLGNRGDGTATIVKGCCGVINDFWFEAKMSFFAKEGVDPALLKIVRQRLNQGWIVTDDDACKFFGMGDNDYAETELTVMYHDDSSTDDRETISLSETLINRARWVDRRKVLALLQENARELHGSFMAGGVRLALHLMKVKVEDDDDKDDVDISWMSACLASILLAVKSTRFGTMYAKLASMIPGIVKKRAMRPSIPGSILKSYPHFALEKGTVAIWKTRANALGIKVGDQINLVRFPASPDGIATFKVAILSPIQGIGFSPIVGDRSRFNLDFDGDRIVFYKTEITGPVYTPDFPDVIEPKWLVTRESARAISSTPIGAYMKQLSAAGCGEQSGNKIGRATRTFDKLSEMFHRMGIWDTERAQTILREAFFGVLQPFIDGLKHKGNGVEVDITASIKELVKMENLPGTTDRSLGHTVMTGIRPALNLSHPLLPRIRELGAVKKHLDEETGIWEDARDVHGNIVINRNKLIAILGDHPEDSPMPFVREVFEELKGIKVGENPNPYHDAAKPFINKKGVSYVAMMMGWNPITNRALGVGMIKQIRDLYGESSRGDRDLTGAQEKVNDLIKAKIDEVFAVLGAQNKWSRTEVQVLMAIVFMAYETKANKGSYGGLFGFPNEVILAASMLLDGSWLMWIATWEMKQDKLIEDAEDAAGLTPGTIRKLAETIGLIG